VVAYLRRGAIIGHQLARGSQSDSITYERIAILSETVAIRGNQGGNQRQSEAIREAITYERIAILSETEAAVGADCVPKISPNTSASPAEMTKRTCMQLNQRQLDGHQ
jgi:hypothetical protein